MARLYPDWILLARLGYITDGKNEIVGQTSDYFTDGKNATFAESHTSDGHRIRVSLFAADPPAISHLCVHFPDMEEADEFSYNPAVIFSRDDLILFAVSFGHRDTSDCFMYKADSEAPSLIMIADPEPCISGLCNTGIVCCGGSEEFAVAALLRDYMTGKFRLSVFDSRTGVWETRLLPLEPSESLSKPNELRFFCSKVISLKGSVLGWVDLWRGILLFDVLSDDPKLHYIPMPDPMPGNQGVEDCGEPSYFRDVIGCGDLIKLVEMDYQDDDDDVVDTNASDYYTPDEWTIVTRTRTLHSGEWTLHSGEWDVGHKVNTEDITVPEDFYRRKSLLPRFYENGTPSLKKMPIGVPTLCDCNDVVYLMCKDKIDDIKGWVVGVNMNSKMLESVSRFSAATLGGFSTAYYPSLFSKYLDNKSV